MNYYLNKVKQVKGRSQNNETYIKIKLIIMAWNELESVNIFYI